MSAGLRRQRDKVGTGCEQEAGMIFKQATVALSVLGFLVLTSAPVIAQSQSGSISPGQPPSSATRPASQPLKPGELDALVAPIAARADLLE
jgi:hypothetical protein